MVMQYTHTFDREVGVTVRHKLQHVREDHFPPVTAVGDESQV